MGKPHFGNKFAFAIDCIKRANVKLHFGFTLSTTPVSAAVDGIALAWSTIGCFKMNTS